MITSYPPSRERQRTQDARQNGILFYMNSYPHSFLSLNTQSRCTMSMDIRNGRCIVRQIMREYDRFLASMRSAISRMSQRICGNDACTIRYKNIHTGTRTSVQTGEWTTSNGPLLHGKRRRISSALVASFAPLPLPASRHPRRRGRGIHCDSRPTRCTQPRAFESQVARSRDLAVA